MEYVIVGDTESYKNCLICVCGGNKAHAEQTIDRILNNPTEYDQMMIKGHTNIRLEKCERENGWWHWGCD